MQPRGQGGHLPTPRARGPSAAITPAAPLWQPPEHKGNGSSRHLTRHLCTHSARAGRAATSPSQNMEMQQADVSHILTFMPLLGATVGTHTRTQPHAPRKGSISTRRHSGHSRAVLTLEADTGGLGRTVCNSRHRPSGHSSGTRIRAHTGTGRTGRTARKNVGLLITHSDRGSVIPAPLHTVCSPGWRNGEWGHMAGPRKMTCCPNRHDPPRLWS